MKHLILGSISPFFLEDDDEPGRWQISYHLGNASTPADVLVGALEEEKMHRGATAVRDFYRAGHQPRPTDHQLQTAISELPAPVFSVTYTVVPEADHELWHPNYLAEIKTTLARLHARPV